MPNVHWHRRCVNDCVEMLLLQELEMTAYNDMLSSFLFPVRILMRKPPLPVQKAITKFTVPNICGGEKLLLFIPPLPYL